MKLGSSEARSAQPRAQTVAYPRWRHPVRPRFKIDTDAVNSFAAKLSRTSTRRSSTLSGSYAHARRYLYWSPHAFLWMTTTFRIPSCRSTRWKITRTSGLLSISNSARSTNAQWSAEVILDIELGLLAGERKWGNRVMGERCGDGASNDLRGRTSSNEDEEYVTVVGQSVKGCSMLRVHEHDGCG